MYNYIPEQYYVFLGIVRDSCLSARDMHFYAFTLHNQLKTHGPDSI